MLKMMVPTIRQPMQLKIMVLCVWPFGMSELVCKDMRPIFLV